MDKELEESTTSDETVENVTEEVTEDVEEGEPSEEDILKDKNKQLFERAKKAEEREKALKAEKEALEAKLATDDDDFDSDDEVKSKVADLSAKLASIEEQAQLDSIYGKHPILKEKLEEFDEFRKEYPIDKLESVAKIFLAENDLLTESTKRKGLEKARGGTRVPPKSGKMSHDDAKRLRENNYEEYRKMLKLGKISLE